MLNNKDDNNNLAKSPYIPLKPYKKATNIEKQYRVDKIVQLKLENKSRQDIINFAKENWDISQPQTDVYIGRANKYLDKISANITEFSVYNAIERHKKLYALAIEAEQYSVAHQINVDINRLGGLYKADNQQQALSNTNIQISIGKGKDEDGGNIVNITPIASYDAIEDGIDDTEELE
jgi:hypothetical protein